MVLLHLLKELATRGGYYKHEQQEKKIHSVSP